MKKPLTFALVAWCLLGTKVSVKADEVWFQKYDTDGNGTWNYQEFSRANDEWYRVHPKEVRITTKQLRHDFDDLDADHDGYVRVEQVRRYHVW